MFGSKLQEFLLNGRRHDQSSVLNTLPPTQQIAGLQGVEHISPLLLLLGGIALGVTSRKSIQLLIVIINGLLLAFAHQNLLTGADGTDAACLIGTALLLVAV